MPKQEFIRVQNYLAPNKKNSYCLTSNKITRQTKRHENKTYKEGEKSKPSYNSDVRIIRQDMIAIFHASKRLRHRRYQKRHKIPRDGNLHVR